MSHRLDWARFVRRDWERAPARLSLDSPVLPAARAFQGLVTASAPFRFGTRFRATQDVRFFVDDARLRAPGPLLPTDTDRSAAHYVRRASQLLGGKKFQLFVEQPFMLDFPLWDGLRHFVSGLLEHVGMPVLPLVSDLSLGNFSHSPQGLAKRLHHSVFTLVLQGRMRVHLWKQLWEDSPNETADFKRHLSEATTLEASAGDVLYTPSRLWQLEECRGSCLAVRVWIPVRGSRPTDVVKEVIVKLLEQRLTHDHSVPYLDYPPRKRRGTAGTSFAPLARAARALEQLTHGEDLEQALRIVWTRRVSACGLEPVPPPRAPQPLEDTARVRKTPHSRIVRMREGPGAWIWAVNGHVFPVLDTPEAARMLGALESGDTLSVGELCRFGRGAPRREVLRSLLETLHALRGLEDVSEPED